MAKWEVVNGGPEGTTYRCTMCNMLVQMRPQEVPMEECPNCGANNKKVGLNYEEMNRKLKEECRHLEKGMEKMKFDLCIAEREREILQAQMEVVRLIFGGRRDD